MRKDSRTRVGWLPYAIVAADIAMMLLLLVYLSRGGRIVNNSIDIWFDRSDPTLETLNQERQLFGADTWMLATVWMRAERVGEAAQVSRLLTEQLERLDGVDQRIGQAGDLLADGVDALGRGCLVEFAEVPGGRRQDHRRGDVRRTACLDVDDLDVALPVDFDTRGELALGQHAEAREELLGSLGGQRRQRIDRRLVVGQAALGRFREGVYVNFLGDDEDPDRVREAYGDSVYDRLVDVKTTYDPDNVFHHNQNIRPGLSDGMRGRRRTEDR